MATRITAIFRDIPKGMCVEEYIELRKNPATAVALRHLGRLFPTRSNKPANAPKNERDVQRSIAHRQAKEIHEDRKVLSRARLDAETAQVSADEQRELRNMRREMFPWEYRD